MFLNDMLLKPSENIRIGLCSCCNWQNEIYQFGITVLQFNTVYCKKYKHCVSPYAFIAIDKRMIFYKTKAQARGFIQ